MAGAPVRARRLRISSLNVGASIRSSDSLQDGTSRFYAEITRLRKLVDLAAAGSLLFLIDELLNGTNSHDRQIGAEAVVRGLVSRGAIGLVTTHDLALTQIAAAMEPRGANVHFEDHLENGKITFDYIMRPGVVRRATLELMRSVGLTLARVGRSQAVGHLPPPPSGRRPGGQAIRLSAPTHTEPNPLPIPLRRFRRSLTRHEERNTPRSPCAWLRSSDIPARQKPTALDHRRAATLASATPRTPSALTVLPFKAGFHGCDSPPKCPTGKSVRFQTYPNTNLL
jgi:hypothetical protein